MHRIAICDDNPYLCTQLERQILELCREYNIEAEIGVWYDGKKLCHHLLEGDDVDLLFLDIRLPSVDGIEAGKFIRQELENYRMCIVYISVGRAYAMELFQNQPFDFLIKPIDKSRLQQTFVRYIRQAEQARCFFEYRSGGCFRKLACEEILYFGSYHKKIVVVTTKGKCEFYGKIRDIIGLLPENFLMIHQSFIVNWFYVLQYQYDEMRMADGTILSISQRYRKEVRRRVIERKDSGTGSRTGRSNRMNLGKKVGEFGQITAQW